MSYVVITPRERPEQATYFTLGKEVPTPSGGLAKWNAIQRPRRRALMDFEGEEPLKLHFDLMLDEWPDGDVDPIIRRVLAWAATMDQAEPPKLRIEGPFPYPEVLYVMTDADLSGDTAFRYDGRRCRQQIKLELTEYVASDPQLLRPAPAHAAHDRQTTAGRTHVVKRGDTLWAISAALLGSGTRWQEIADLNGIRDPRKLQIGRTLRIPT